MITSAATDSFAAIFASPGATAPTGDAIAPPAGGVFGAMVAATPAAPPVVAIAPPSFGGAWPGASPVMPTGPMMSITMVANAAPVVPAMIPTGASPTALVPIVTAGPQPASVTPALSMQTEDAPTSLPPAIVRTMPAPAPSPGLRSAALVASLPAAWSSAPAGVPALPVATPTVASLPTPAGLSPTLPLVAAPQPDLVLRVASDTGPIGNMPLPAVPFPGSALPGSPDAPPVAGQLSGTLRSDVITPAPPLVGGTKLAASGKPVLIAAPLPDLVLRTGPDGGPPLNDPVPATPLVTSAEPAVSGKPVLVAVPLPDLVLRTGPDAAPTPGDPMPVDAPPVVVPQSVDRTAAPKPTPTGVDVAKPSAPRKLAMAPAPVPMVFAPAQASPVAAPVAVKGAATPVEHIPVEDGAPADAEDTDPAATAFPPMTAVQPLLPDIATAPAPEAAVATPDPSADGDAGDSTHDAPMTAPVTPVATPVSGQPPATSGKVEVAASSDRPAAVAAAGLRPVRDEAVPADQKPVTTATPDPRSFAALVEPKVVAPAPAPAPTTATASPVPEARVAAEPGRMGHEMAVAIARHTAEGGGEALTVRLNPAEFGRIDVTLSFDDRGTLRAVLAAETPAALDLLRRDSADLGRALSDAGMRTDTQSFRFDTRQGGADAGGQGAQGQPRWQAAATPRNASTTADLPEPEYRPLRSRGGVDLMA